MRGQRIEVYLNGVRVNEYTSARDIALGHIGVQNDGEGLDIHYRDIRIRHEGAQSTDLARGRPVEVTSVEPGSGHVGANAVDGDPATRWGSAYADPQSITVDLGAEHALTGVRLAWETAYARAYTIETSVDGVTWETVHTATAGDGGLDEIALDGTVARHVRLTGTERATQWGYSLWDLAVFGD
ncbi:DUF1080 domain-containing protein [Streptomyces radicis]|uniref:DUF1080 domain-containing protein n=1 Tax=Streptomyces radicis TaxID=1750517 RepID=A0A3A9VXI3_9ACTN|nr:DUF1080 domain-containing protein [Streptomyces radicis]RKN25383.1 DUF1080 domain-containing protein [Streptomyces radicis]